MEHFDVKNISQFQASVLGNIFGLKELEELYVFDISFPKKYQKQFKGPYAGVEGIRKMVGTQKSRRPHIGTIVKPKVGLAPKEWAKVAYESYAGGLDLVDLTELNLAPVLEAPVRNIVPNLVFAGSGHEVNTVRVADPVPVRDDAALTAPS